MRSVKISVHFSGPLIFPYREAAHEAGHIWPTTDARPGKRFVQMTLAPPSTGLLLSLPPGETSANATTLRAPIPGVGPSVVPLGF